MSRIAKSLQLGLEREFQFEICRKSFALFRSNQSLLHDVIEPAELFVPRVVPPPVQIQLFLGRSASRICSRACFPDCHTGVETTVTFFLLTKKDLLLFKSLGLCLGTMAENEMETGDCCSENTMARNDVGTGECCSVESTTARDEVVKAECCGKNNWFSRQPGCLDVIGIIVILIIVLIAYFTFGS